MDSSMYYKALHDNAAADADSAALVGSSDIGSTASTAAPRVEDGSVSMDNFYPALVQCFGIIICGWVKREQEKGVKWRKQREK